jgi:hypothetical protein
MGPRQTHEGEEVLVEDIINRPDSEKEEDADIAEASPSTVG